MQDKYLNELAKTMLELKDRKDVLSFLSWILTPQEIEQLPVRLQIVKMLKKGTAQREIAKKLGVGIATVTRGAKELQRSVVK